MFATGADGNLSFVLKLVVRPFQTPPFSPSNLASSHVRPNIQQEFLREFGNLATFSFAFSIMGVSSSVAITFTTPMMLGGPASVVWCWFIGAVFAFFIGTAIAELVSAYPTSGAL